MSRSILTLALGVALGACAPSGEIASPGLQTAAPAPHLRQTADPATGDTRLVLNPVPVEQHRRGEIELRSRVAVGAILITRDEGDRRVGGLALVVQTIAAPTRPVMARNRFVILEVDGVRVEGDLSGTPRLYNAELGQDGLVETLIVPVGYELMARVADAGRIRVEVGHEVKADLGARHRTAFASFLQKVPAPDARATDRIAYGAIADG